MRTIQDIGFYSEDKKTPLPPAATITVQEYEASIHNGKYKTIPLSGIEIINRTNKLIKKHIPNHSGNMGDIHVYRDHLAYPGMLNKEVTALTTISSIAFERVIGVVDLLEIPDYSCRLAIKFEADNFVEMSIGTNVKICQNYCIFGGNSIIRTNRRQDIDLEFLLNAIEQNIIGAKSKLQFDLALIHSLAQKAVDYSEVKEILGELLMYSRGKEPVIQQTDLVLAADVYAKEVPLTAWGVLQGLTQGIKFNNSSGNATSQHLNNVCNYMVDRFGILSSELVAEDVEALPA